MMICIQTNKYAISDKPASIQAFAGWVKALEVCCCFILSPDGLHFVHTTAELETNLPS